MTHDTTIRPAVPGVELFEGAEAFFPRVTLMTIAPVARLRSPIMERRPVGAPVRDEDRLTVPLPPWSSFIDASGIALIIAVPLLLVAGWQVAVVAAVLAPLVRQLRRMADRMPFSIGDGFLPYRAETGWPHGVREDNDVRWNWSPTAADGRAGGDARPSGLG